MVEADGHPDWRIDPSSAIGLLKQSGGDIATLAGVADKVTQISMSLALKAVGTDEQLSHGVEGPSHCGRCGGSGMGSTGDGSAGSGTGASCSIRTGDLTSSPSIGSSPTRSPSGP